MLKYGEFIEKLQDTTLSPDLHDDWCATRFAEFAECDCSVWANPSPKNRQKD